jgi:hypothetical protein
MSWSSNGSLGSVQSKVANQASLTLTAAMAASPGKLLVLIIAVDNHGSGDGDENAIKLVTDSVGNIWREAREFANGQGGAQRGTVCSVWYCNVTKQLNSGSTIVIQFTNPGDRDASAATGWVFANDHGTVYVSTADARASDNAQPGTLSPTTTNAEFLRVRGVAGEMANTATPAFSPTASWTTFTANGTTGGGAASNMSVRGEWRIATGTAFSSNPGWASADDASVYVAFSEALESERLFLSGSTTLGGLGTFNISKSFDPETGTELATLPHAYHAPMWSWSEGKIPWLVPQGASDPDHDFGYVDCGGSQLIRTINYQSIQSYGGFFGPDAQGRMVVRINSRVYWLDNDYSTLSTIDGVDWGALGQYSVPWMTPSGRIRLLAVSENFGSNLYRVGLREFDPEASSTTGSWINTDLFIAKGTSGGHAPHVLPDGGVYFFRRDGVFNLGDQPLLILYFLTPAGTLIGVDVTETFKFQSGTWFDGSPQYSTYIPKGLALNAASDKLYALFTTRGNNALYPPWKNRVYRASNADFSDFTLLYELQLGPGSDQDLWSVPILHPGNCSSTGGPGGPSPAPNGDDRYCVHSKALSLAGASLPPSWINDVRNLGVGRVRVDVRYTVVPEAADCDADDATIDQALASISATLVGYKTRGVEPLAILTGGILAITLDPNNPSNSFRPGAVGVCAATGQTYMQAFPARAAMIAAKLHASAGVTCFQIWNEPNVPNNADLTENPQYIGDYNTFAQLVSNTASAIRAALSGVDVTIVTGGVFISDINPTSDTTYLIQTMSALKALGPACWQQIGVHNYRSGPTNANSTQNALDTAFTADAIDPRTMWLTEFGVQRGCTDSACSVVEPSGSAQRIALEDWYTNLINPRLVTSGGTIDAAFWFSHEKEQESANPPTMWNNWGLTNWDSDGHINPTTQHWPSWAGLQQIIQAEA